MKDITIKILGKHCFDGKEEDQLEFITEGRGYRRGDTVYLLYDETQVSGLEGCKTTIRVKGDTLKLKRIGDAGYNSELYFEKGKRFNGSYETDLGLMDVEVMTNYVKNSIDIEEICGTVDVGYDISLQGIAEGRNKIIINVM